MVRAQTIVRCVAGTALGWVAGVRADDAVEVTTRGEGTNREAARLAALRNALEEGGRVEISSHSQTENFALVRDTIYARAEGLVSDYQVLEELEGAGGTFICRIRAVVNRSAIASTWLEVQNVLDQLGRPKAMVLIFERIDGRPQEDSILASRIEERLAESGFDLVDSAQADAIAARESADATSEANVLKAQAIAKDFGAHVLIVGSCDADAAENKSVHGIDLMMYNCNAQLKIVYSDTGRVLASKSLANVRGGARGYESRSLQAGKMAIDNAAGPLIDETWAAVMRAWATQISAGAELIVEVEGLSASDAVNLNRRLADITGVQRVNHDLTKGIAQYRLTAKLTGLQLAEQLVEGEWRKLIEIVDIKPNRIQAKAVSRAGSGGQE